ncbi:hypothetical protein GCM10027176_53520 [Actinoallomurus bryophytorum]
MRLADAVSHRSLRPRGPPAFPVDRCRDARGKAGVIEHTFASGVLGRARRVTLGLPGDREVIIQARTTRRYRRDTVDESGTLTIRRLF